MNGCEDVSRILLQSAIPCDSGIHSRPWFTRQVSKEFYKWSESWLTLQGRLFWSLNDKASQEKRRKRDKRIGFNFVPVDL